MFGALTLKGNVLHPPNSPTQRAATVLEVKAVAVFFLEKKKESDVERLLVTHHGVQDGEELSHASGERHLFQFAAF